MRIQNKDLEGVVTDTPPLPLKKETLPLLDGEEHLDVDNYSTPNQNKDLGERGGPKAQHERRNNSSIYSSCKTNPDKTRTFNEQSEIPLKKRDDLGTIFSEALSLEMGDSNISRVDLKKKKSRVHRSPSDAQM